MDKQIIGLRTQGPIPDIANYSRREPGVVFTREKSAVHREHGLSNSGRHGQGIRRRSHAPTWGALG